MTSPERSFPEPDEAEFKKPALYIVDSAAQTVHTYIGETDQDVHTELNDLQREGAIAARSGGGHLGPEYTEMANKAYLDQLQRRAKQYDPHAIKAALREERLRREQ